MLSSLPDTIHCNEHKLLAINLAPPSTESSYLATSHREVGENAVSFVLVSSVRLQALPLRVVPKLKGVIEGGRKDVLSVRRELNEGNGRVVVVDECLQALTTGRVPDSAETVVTG